MVCKCGGVPAPDMQIRRRSCRRPSRPSTPHVKRLVAGGSFGRPLWNVPTTLPARRLPATGIEDPLVPLTGQCSRPRPYFPAVCCPPVTMLFMSGLGCIPLNECPSRQDLARMSRHPALDAGPERQSHVFTPALAAERSLLRICPIVRPP